MLEAEARNHQTGGVESGKTQESENSPNQGILEQLEARILEEAVAGNPRIGRIQKS